MARLESTSRRPVRAPRRAVQEGSTLVSCALRLAVGTMLVLYLHHRSDRKETPSLELNVLKDVYSTPT
jgi:hypothetical protein